MRSDESALPARVGRLRAAIDGVKGALADVDLARLTAAEPELVEAVEAARAAAGPVTGDVDRQAVRADLAAARAALAMCRRYGSLLTEMDRVTAAARGESVDYTRQGQRVGRRLVSSAIEARV